MTADDARRAENSRELIGRQAVELMMSRFRWYLRPRRLLRAQIPPRDSYTAEESKLNCPGLSEGSGVS